MRVGNKRYPGRLKSEVEKALLYYPDLEHIAIEFRWGVFTQHSFMLAQPKPLTLLRNRNKREYQIIMRKKFFLKNNRVPNSRIPSDVLVGWLGHELGHVADYKDRSSWNLAWFGICYYFSKTFLKKAEISADLNAVKHGLIKELVVSKEFGRNPAYFPWSYIKKLQKFYPSIEDVLKWDKELNNET
ncbi:MAG: hypothetical protein ACI9JN_000791 [Bacteroidia bacterium]|jgi:hypothetical protein